MGCKLVAYFRVSTQKQGQSGLGLEGQVASVEAYAKATGCELVGSYTEVESGKRSDRAELAKAIAHARRTKATLVIAKLDRLSRNVAFLANLMESGVGFIACDNPNANPLTIHILAAVAEDEARRISERTKTALTAYKARGGILGATRPECRNLTDEARKRGIRAAGQAVAKLATEAYQDLEPLLRECVAAGMTQKQIADRLNGDGHSTRTGKPFGQVQVLRMLKRYGLHRPRNSNS